MKRSMLIKAVGVMCNLRLAVAAALAGCASQGKRRDEATVREPDST